MMQNDLTYTREIQNNIHQYLMEIETERTESLGQSSVFEFPKSMRRWYDGDGVWTQTFTSGKVLISQSYKGTVYKTPIVRLRTQEKERVGTWLGIIPRMQKEEYTELMLNDSGPFIQTLHDALEDLKNIHSQAVKNKEQRLKTIADARHAKLLNAVDKEAKRVEKLQSVKKS